MAKIQKTEQPEHTPEELAKLRERQRKQQENIDWLNAQAPLPATWTIGKELGELPVAIGSVNAISAKGPRKDADEKP